MNISIHIKKMTLAAMLLALGMVLPLLTGQIPEIGNMLLPMHFPVLLCGLICGWQYGAAVGFVMPLLRFAIFSMPKMPNALSMAFELAAYGLTIGLLYGLSKKKGIAALYGSLIGSMVIGRIVWGAAQWVILGIRGEGFPFQAFLAGAVLNAVPGILLQLILIPALILALRRAGMLPIVGNDVRSSP